MEKKLPKVYANKIEKDINNNKKIDYSTREEQSIEKPKSKIDQAIQNTKKNINQKINDIFSSPRYVYKAEVEIRMKDRTIIKKIIGQNQNQLITLDNELIPISEIEDIYFAK